MIGCSEKKKFSEKPFEQRVSLLVSFELGLISLHKPRFMQGKAAKEFWKVDRNSPTFMPYKHTVPKSQSMVGKNDPLPCLASSHTGIDGLTGIPVNYLSWEEKLRTVDRSSKFKKHVDECQQQTWILQEM